MESFTYTSNPSHVLFGTDALSSLPSELTLLSISRPLIVTGPRGAAQLSSISTSLETHGISPAGTFTRATQHTPVPITTEALSMLQQSRADGIVSIGGGSAIGLGKALSIRTGLPHIAIPTTYAGSEMTPVLGETEGGKKTTRSDPKILPKTVIYDVLLTMDLPPALSAVSGVNGMAHAIEALYAFNTNPIVHLHAYEALRSLSESLPILIDDPTSVSARHQALYGAFLSSLCLSTAQMGLQHKLAHTLGGTFNLPHAETHTILLPYTLAYNLPSIPSSVAQKLAGCLSPGGGKEDAVAEMNELLRKLGVKRALRDVGMREENIERAAEMATEKAYPNPRALERDKIREVIRRAWAGEEARADL